MANITIIIKANVIAPETTFCASLFGLWSSIFAKNENLVISKFIMNATRDNKIGLLENSKAKTKNEVFLWLMETLI